MAQTTSRIDQLLAANATFAKTWTAPLTMEQMRNSPNDGAFVLTCMDPRVVPEQFLGPEPRVGVFRNAGGRFDRDVVRSITVLRSLRLKNDKLTLMVVHHTDCGMLHLTDEQIRADVEKRNPHEQDPMRHFGVVPPHDLEQSILDDVEAFKKESLLDGVDIRGFVLSTETGLLKEL